MPMADCEEMDREREGWRILAGGGDGHRVDMSCAIK